MTTEADTGAPATGGAMRRLLFWALVALTVAGVAVGVWYYVRDDYPFQVTAAQIGGLSYQVGTSGLVVSGTVSDPPVELADWLSNMEQDASDSPMRPTGVAIVRLTDGRSLALAVDFEARLGSARWVSASGLEGAPVRVHLGQDLVWYLHGVQDGLGERGGTRASVPASQAGPATQSPASESPTPQASQ